MEIQGISGAMSSQPAERVRQAQQAPAEQAPEPEKVPRYDKYVPGDAAPERKRASLTTANTDRVDQELRKLREKRSQVEEQLRAAADPAQAERLEQELSRLEGELRQKDNDAYRRQHAVFS